MPVTGVCCSVVFHLDVVMVVLYLLVCVEKSVYGPMTIRLVTLQVARLGSCSQRRLVICRLYCSYYHIVKCILL